MRSLFITLFTSFSLLAFAQEQVDIQILDLQKRSSNVEISYVTLEQSDENGPSFNLVMLQESITASADLRVYFYHPQFGLLRTHLKDLIAHGPKAWKERVFRLFFENGEPVKMEEIYVLR